MATYCYGIDVGGTTVKMGLFKTTGDLLEKWEIPTRTENMGEAILPDIAIQIQKNMQERQIAIGIGVPAPVFKNGIVKTTVNLGWGYKEVKAELEGLIGIKVNVANDANIAALGEMWMGGGMGSQDIVMVTLGTGVGGGIIIDGRIHTGTNGAGGEIGHMVVNDKETENCNCGKRGCLEQYLLENKKKTILDVEALSAKAVFDAVKEGDESAIAIAEEFGAYLGMALASIAAVVDPEVFVLGGGVSKAGEILIELVHKNFVPRAFWATRETKITLATL